MGEKSSKKYELSCQKLGLKDLLRWFDIIVSLRLLFVAGFYTLNDERRSKWTAQQTMLRFVLGCGRKINHKADGELS